MKTENRAHIPDVICDMRYAYTRGWVTEERERQKERGKGKERERIEKNEKNEKKKRAEEMEGVVAK